MRACVEKVDVLGWNKSYVRFDCVLPFLVKDRMLVDRDCLTTVDYKVGLGW